MYFGDLLILVLCDDTILALRYIHALHTYGTYIYLHIHLSSYLHLSVCLYPRYNISLFFFLLGMEWKYWDKIDGLGRSWLVYVEGFGSGFTMNTQVMKNDSWLAYALPKSSFFWNFIFLACEDFFFLFLLIPKVCLPMQNQDLSIYLVSLDIRYLFIE